MSLPFIMGRKSQTAISRNVIWEATTQLFVHSVRLIVITHNARDPLRKKKKAARKHSWCMKLLNSDLAGKEKKKVGKVEYFLNISSIPCIKLLSILTKHFSISKAALLSMAYASPTSLQSTSSLNSDI